jgi:hypothetical protein
VSIVRKGTSRSCRFACAAFSVHRYIFGRVLNRGFVNPRVRAIHCVRLFLALQTDLKVPSGHHVEVRVLSSALTAIVSSLTRTTPVERPFRFILVFADDASPAT